MSRVGKHVISSIKIGADADRRRKRETYCLTGRGSRRKGVRHTNTGKITIIIVSLIERVMRKKCLPWECDSSYLGMGRLFLLRQRGIFL